jgi:hypothetical protein
MRVSPWTWIAFATASLAVMPLAAFSGVARARACEGADAAPGADRLPQRILYIGDSKSPRAAAFREFFGQRFAAVDVADRGAFDPKKTESCDVVVLDWPQTPITAQNASQREELFPPKTSPIGERAAWKKPTVLLGSAGLMLSCVWGLKGGAG